MPFSCRTVFVVIATPLAVAGWFSSGRSLVASIRTEKAVERLVDVAQGQLPPGRFTALSGTSRVHADGVMRDRDDGKVVLQARVGGIRSPRA
jgi:hypothetical protein